MSRTRLSPRLLLAAVLLAFTPLAVRAQQEESVVRWGLGYVANAPEMMGGLSGTLVLPAMGGIGLYVDAKFNLDSPRGDELFLDGLTSAQVESQVAGVQFRDRMASYQGFNVALLKQVSSSLLFYAGGGLTTKSNYIEYRDPSQELGIAGIFTVEAPDEEETLANVLVGVIMRISPLLHLQTGFETEPGGFTVGGMFILPKR